ncbi:TrmH family RNA methyltransferase [Sandaracinus amylolyticus]|nr:RNA methyltransferase [Sandaracinus amylolyticus]
MKRDLPEVIELAGLAPLPKPAAEIVRVLSPLVTPQRWARIEAVVSRRTRSLVPVLEDLADPHNGAAVMRSADAFGCQEVHVVEGRHRFAVSHRVTRGTHRWLDLVRHEGPVACMDHLHARGYEVFVAAMDGDIGPEELAKKPKVAIVFGNEHKGASPEVRARVDGVYRIPMEGFVESLNVSVASAITLYVASRGRHGDLDEAARDEIRARFLLATVRDAERVVKERV